MKLYITFFKQKINSNLSQKDEEHIFTNFIGDVHYKVTHQTLATNFVTV
jgi:hypothetical protein